MLSFYLAMVDTPEDKLLVENLYTACERMMYRTAFRVLRQKYDAEDAVHEAFLSIIKGDALKKLKSMTDIERKSYITVIVRNSAYKVYNKRKKNNENSIHNDSDNSNSTEEAVLSSLSVEEIQETMNMLTESDYDILCLYLINEQTYEEIAAALDIKPDTARQRVHRAKKRLMDKLQERGINNDQ